MGETPGRFEQQGVHEGLREIAAQLPFDDVEFLGEQRRGAACGAVAFEPPHGLDGVALLMVGEGHEEPAQQECAFGVGEGTVVVAEAVDIAVAAEFGADGVERAAAQSVGGG